jgi:hypothetical protein
MIMKTRGRRTEQLSPQADPQGQRNSFAEERRERDEANCCNEPRNTQHAIVSTIHESAIEIVPRDNPSSMSRSQQAD